MLGGGKAMMNAYYETASKLGVQIAYESEVRELEIHDGEFHSAIAFAMARHKSSRRRRSLPQRAVLKRTSLG